MTVPIQRFVWSNTNIGNLAGGIFSDIFTPKMCTNADEKFLFTLTNFNFEVFFSLDNGLHVKTYSIDLHTLKLLQPTSNKNVHR